MTNILNLIQYNIISIKEGHHDYHIDAETAEPADICRSCFSENVVGGGRQEILIKDLPMHGKRVGIYVKARRFRCLDCGRTRTEILPNVVEGQRMTTRLYHWICKHSINRTFTSIADEVGISEGTVRIIFAEYVKQLERTVVFETPEWMGIDEIHIIKKPRCVFTNVETNTVFNLLPDRSKVLVTNYLMKLNKRQNIKCVTMDMWQPYRDAVYGCLPQAFIVVDKFHVLRMANASLEVVRKAIRADLTTKQRRGLMHDRFILLKRESELEPFERLTLESWTRNFPALGEAYYAKERFFAFYESMSIPEAQQSFSEWKDGLSEAIRSAYKPLTTAMSNWETEIMNYFEHPVTNAYTESLNSLIRVVNRCGRGYSFEALRAKILYSAGAHKIVTPPFQRQGKNERLSVFECGAAPDDSTTFVRPGKNYGTDVSTLLSLIENGKL